MGVEIASGGFQPRAQVPWPPGPLDLKKKSRIEDYKENQDRDLYSYCHSNGLRNIIQTMARISKRIADLQLAQRLRSSHWLAENHIELVRALHAWHTAETTGVPTSIRSAAWIRVETALLRHLDDGEAE